MTKNEAVALIQQVLGFRSDLVGPITKALVLAQIKLEFSQPKPWFLTSETATIRTTVAEARVGLPSDFLVEEDNAHLYYLPADGSTPVLLKKDYYDQLMADYANAASGPPKAYALLGNVFVLFPTPDAVYTIAMKYVEGDDTITTVNTNLWLTYAPYYLLGEAGWMVASSINHGSAINTFTSMRNSGKVDLIAHNAEREVSNMELQIGGPH